MIGKRERLSTTIDVSASRRVPQSLTRTVAFASAAMPRSVRSLGDANDPPIKKLDGMR